MCAHVLAYLFSHLMLLNKQIMAKKKQRLYLSRQVRIIFLLVFLIPLHLVFTCSRFKCLEFMFALNAILKCHLKDHIVYRSGI